MGHLLSLDLSTNATGWAKFDITTKALLAYDVIKPDFKNPTVKGVPTYIYPVHQTLKLRRMVEQILELLDQSTTSIVIEEINGSKNRLGQKTLDSLHAVLLEKMPHWALLVTKFVDSDGKDGWRSQNGLKLQLSQHDKDFNKEAKKANKKLAKGTKKFPVITQKTLACKYVNRKYGLSLDCDKNTTDGDKADAIGLGTHTLEKVLI